MLIKKFAILKHAYIQELKADIQIYFLLNIHHYYTVINYQPSKKISTKSRREN